MFFHASLNQGQKEISQVARILQQMCELRPSAEKSREIVVDKNGDKKIRVVKRRRVPATVQRREKGDCRRSCFYLIFALLIGGVYFAAQLTP